jgi:hypothetical protein
MPVVEIAERNTRDPIRDIDQQTFVPSDADAF